MRIIATSVLIMNLLFACQSPGSLSQEQRQIEEVLEVAENAKYHQRYVQIQEEKVVFEQEQWAKIQPLDSLEGYRHLEIYNVYKAEDGGEEYYVSEFELNINDTINRQPITDYQVIINHDTAYIQLSEENDFKLAQKFEYDIGSNTYQVYKLLGYAHKTDEAPVHYKYWSPDFGTLMIYSGKHESFELVENKEGKDAIKVLVQEIKKRMGMRKI